LTAATRGRTSRGISSVDSRRLGRDGPISPTISDASRPIEIGPDVINQPSALDGIVAGLDPDRLIADDVAEAHTEHHPVAASLLQERDVVQPRVGWKQGLLSLSDE
jgi:hypothetical protein